jgi:hypothetical protein
VNRLKSATVATPAAPGGTDEVSQHFADTEREWEEPMRLSIDDVDRR